MSISPVGGVGAVPVHLPVTTAKPASREATSAPDSDGDSDNSGAPTAPAANATVNVKA